MLPPDPLYNLILKGEALAGSCNALINLYVADPPRCACVSAHFVGSRELIRTLPFKRQFFLSEPGMKRMSGLKNDTIATAARCATVSKPVFAIGRPKAQPCHSGLAKFAGKMSGSDPKR